MHIPHRCEYCQLSLDAGPKDLAPVRFQIIELPPILAEVVEHQACTRVCGGTINQATIPAYVRAHVFGPRFTATVAQLSGAHGISKRATEEIARGIFGVPIALGTICNLEREVSAAIAPAHAEAVEAVKQAEVKFADETCWKRKGAPRWLWTAAAAALQARPAPGAAAPRSARDS